MENTCNCLHVFKSTYSDERIVDVKSDCSLKAVAAARPVGVFMREIDDLTHLVANRRLRLEGHDWCKDVVVDAGK